MKLFVDSILYSYAQIFFSNRKWFGLAALLISFFDFQVGAMGLLGVILSNAFAFYLKFDKEKIRNGFYGFNGILIGAAIAFFFQITPFVVGIAVVFIFLTFFISASLEHLMANVFNLPGLSLPFILTLYIFLIVILQFPGVYYRDIFSSMNNYISFLPDWMNLFFSSVALILLQTKAIAGFFFLLIILVFSRVMFVNTILAFLINYAIVNFFFAQPSQTLLILTSFNAVLTAFALGGSMIIISRKTLPLLFLTIFFVIIFTLFFDSILKERLLPVLVLPFNVVTLSTIYSLKFRKESTDLTLLYFTPGSPEENFYYHTTRVARFEGFKYLFAELPFFGSWVVTQAFDGEYTHKDGWKYAWDFEIADERGSFFDREGREPEDFYCFNTPVASPLEGEVVRVVDGIPDNKIGEVNLAQNWGNTVIIDHGEGLYSHISHLKRKSITVKEGDKVRKGQIIGRCGNSGRSPRPHLHFQFQLTDKLGDKTYKFPFAQYLTEKADGEELRVFDYPQKDETVRNIDTHKTIKNAFTFKLGDEFVFECELNEKEFTEKWKVNVDILNVTYIENQNGDRLNIYVNEKMFYAMNYVGKKKSALHYFYLAATKVPLGYSQKLVWNDVYPLSSVYDGFARYLSELFLLAGQMIKAEGKFNWFKKENDEEFELISKLNVSGLGLFSFFQRTGNGKVVISNEGEITEIHHEGANGKFKAIKKEFNK